MAQPEQNVCLPFFKSHRPIRTVAFPIGFAVPVTGNRAVVLIDDGNANRIPPGLVLRRTALEVTCPRKAIATRNPFARLALGKHDRIENFTIHRFDTDGCAATLIQIIQQHHSFERFFAEILLQGRRNSEGSGTIQLQLAILNGSTAVQVEIQAADLIARSMSKIPGSDWMQVCGHLASRFDQLLLRSQQP